MKVLSFYNPPDKKVLECLLSEVNQRRHPKRHRQNGEINEESLDLNQRQGFFIDTLVALEKMTLALYKEETL